ncbi:Zn-dependent amino-or carboxypeptidase, M28 family [Lentzea fradiae]|uniref:Vacuolar membrane protease n=1 Tax=Lentzea fradiae TaxID=200378 RepID=A0A1G8DEF5_9PSEU|nr:M20/M25/M40 family metallo-hydrolase [Lentzea fradiae]SDH56023.1 Zn-dependent amino-or carboxypeptidase, M28 family [Lentzea fradiae]
MQLDRRPVLGVLAAIALLGALAVVAFAPPAARSGDVPAREFSAQRAVAHLEQIAQRPHPTGTPDNARVRSYVADTARSLGAQVEVDSGDVVRAGWGNPFPAAHVHNVLARLPGTDPQRSGGKTLLLVAHYDSVPTGPGAADNGAAVAGLLETIRALKARGGTPNDVAFLFTDAEEIGGLGAERFVRSRGVDGLGAVLNWEARGSSGPVLMFETSVGNAELIDAYADTGTRPAGNSLAYEIYQRMPNGTDFTVFKDAGARGLNAAFLDGFHDYHSPHDDIANLDQDSLQHHGETMLGLVDRLGSTDLRTLAAADNAVYFDLFARVLVHYPSWVALLLAVATVLGLGALVVLGVRRRALHVTGVLAVAAVSVGAVAVTAAVGVGLWQLVLAVRPGLSALPLEEPYERGWFVAGFLLAAAAVVFAAAGVVRHREQAEVLAGVLLVGTVVVAATAVTVPGASYLLQWPVLAGLVVLGLCLRRGHAGAVLLGLPAAVTVVLFAPLVGAVLVALGLQLAAVALALAALGGLLLLPLLTPLRRAAVVLPAVVALALVGTGLARSGFERTEPRTNALLYVHDLTENSSTWLTRADETDAWTSAVLGASPRRTRATTYFPQEGPDSFLAADAPRIDLLPPEVKVLADDGGGGPRTVRFSVSSRRDAWRIVVRLPQNRLRECTFAGTRMDAATLSKDADYTGGVVFQYTGDSDTFELSCAVTPGPLPVDASDQTIGLPDEVAALAGPRPEDTAPMPFGFTPADTAVARHVVEI